MYPCTQCTQCTQIIYQKLPPCNLCKMGADEKADDIVLAGDGEEDSILVAWLAFGFWHQS